MAFCTNCGKELPVNSNHCPNCGAPVRTADRQPAEEMLRPQPFVREQEYPQYGQHQPGAYPRQSQDPYPYPADYLQADPYLQPVVPVPVGGLTAWAIITLLLCTIPGIVALVKVTGINSSRTAAEQEERIRSAKGWCTAGTILGLLYMVAYAALRV